MDFVILHEPGAMEMSLAQMGYTPRPPVRCLDCGKEADPAEMTWQGLADTAIFDYYLCLDCDALYDAIEEADEQEAREE